MDIGSQTSTSGTINTLWRALLSSPSQLVLARILKGNLETILVNFDRAGLVDLSQEEIAEVTHAPEDLNKICYLIFAKHYGASTSGGGPIRKMCQSIQRPEHMSRLDMSTSQVSALRRRAEDLVCACSALVHCRNVNAHEHYPIDDPGFALMLAGSITRIIEVAEISEDLQKPAERLRRQCDDILRVSAKMSADDDDHNETPVSSNLNNEDAEQIVSLLTTISSRIDQIDRAAPGSRDEPKAIPPGRNKDTITANDLGAKFITGQIKRENSALAAKISSQLREMPTIEEIEMIVQSVVRKSLESTNSEVDIEDKLGQLMERFQNGIEEIRGSIADSSSQTKEETRAQQDLIDRKISELRNIFSNSQANQNVVDVSDAYFLEDEAEYETTSAPPAITPQQARNQLFQLRNQIRDEQEAEGTPIDNWENIIQGPIIERMIGDRISTLEEWQNEPTIAYKYERNKEVMDRQLDRYQSMIFAVMRQIEA